MTYIYIHGFNSGARSRSARELQNILGKSVFPVTMNYALPFSTCLEDLYKQLNSICPATATEGICLMGSSLGGFYAMQVRRPGLSLIIAWNPVVCPALQLARFVGTNIRFTDGVRWDFERPTLLSYAEAPDGRQWQNVPGVDYGVTPPRTVFIGLKDELLDPALGMLYWGSPTYAIQVHTLEEGHSIADYSSSKAALCK